MSLTTHLRNLRRPNWCFAGATPPQAFYTFKHALVRDAAYESLLKAQRKDLHARIAQVLKERFADRVAVEPEVLAHHYTASGDIGPAIDSWLAAGERATERSANAEAIAHLRRGLDLITELPEGVERSTSRIAATDRHWDTINGP